MNQNYPVNKPMKPFTELTIKGQLRRVRVLARETLKQYPINVSRFDLVGYYTNIIYRVYDQNGDEYALRIARPGWRDIEAANSEALWLEALARDTEISVPKIVPTKTGKPVAIGQVGGVPEARHAVLMTWQPGQLLGQSLTIENLEKMGHLFGQLHQHGSTWQPPQGFSQRQFNRFLSRGEPDLTLADESLSAYAPNTEAVLRQMHEMVNQAYADLAQDGLCVIHCDLWHDNIKRNNGVLYPFDFEDTIWGYRLHDIAMAMLDLYEEVDMGDYERLLAAFRQGYEVYLPWPVGDIALLQIGRILWRLNFIAHFSSERLGPNANFYGTLFERYLAEGKLIPPLRPS